MNLKQEVSLDTIKNLFGKKKKGGQLKTTINFVGIGEQETNWGLAIPGIIIILILAALFSKFGVIDRFSALYAAQSEVSALQAHIDEGRAELDGSSELTEEFYHNTWTGMTEEEITRERRVDIAGLVSFVYNQGLDVQSYALSDINLTVAVSGSSLEQISGVVSAVREQDIVETCVVTVAETDSETGKVSAQLSIKITTIGENDEEVTE